MAQEKILIDFTQFPLTHELIFKKILFYSGVQVAINCLKVCPLWNSYLQSSNIWHQLLRNEALKAQNFTSEARSSVEGVGNGWLEEFSSNFVIKKLEIDSLRSRDVLYSGKLKDICSAGKHLSQSLELAKKIKTVPNDLESHPQLVHEFMMMAETRLERIRKRYRDRAGLVCGPNEEEMHEFMLTTSNECGFSSETYFQAVRIAELGSLHPRVKMNKMKLAITSLAVASYEVEGASLSPSLLHDYFFDADLDEDEEYGNSNEDEDEEEELSRYMDLIKRELRYSWYHPSPGMFLHNFLRMMKERDNRDLVHLASYFADLLTGFTGCLSGGGCGHMAPSLIARGSLAAASHTLVPGGLGGLSSGQNEEEVAAARDRALYLHKVVRGNTYHAVFERHAPMVESSLEIDTETRDWFLFNP